MLETLQRYADVEIESRAKSPRSIRLPLDRRFDNRFFTLLSLSIACHIAFYVGLIVLDSWVGHRPPPRPRPKDSEELVKIADLATKANQHPLLRPPPDRLRPVDLSNMVYNPNLRDDTNLVARSPHPGTGSGDSANKGRTGRQPGELPGSSSSGARQAGDAQSRSNQPPGARPIEMRQAPAQTEQANAALPSTQPAPVPPPPPQRQNTRPRIADDSGGRDGKDEGSGRPREFGLAAVESQYQAYVKQRIYDENRRIMPKDWITSVLSKEVSADFNVTLARDGRIVAMRMLRSCGYPNLDRVARDAISLASPFRGYPASLPADTITVTVTVHYTPFG